MPISSSVNTLSAEDLYLRNVTSGYVVVLRGQANFLLLSLSVQLVTTFGRMDTLYKKHTVMVPLCKTEKSIHLVTMLTGIVIAMARAVTVSCLKNFLGGIFIFRQVNAANFPAMWFLRYARLIL